MTENYLAFHCELLNKDLLLSLGRGGLLRLFVGRCHQAEPPPQCWQQLATLILLPTRRQWRGFSQRLQTRAAFISYFICGSKEVLQKPPAPTGGVSTAYLVITELKKSLSKQRAPILASLANRAARRCRPPTQARPAVLFDPVHSSTSAHSTPRESSAPQRPGQSVHQVHGQQSNSVENRILSCLRSSAQAVPGLNYGSVRKGN